MNEEQESIETLKEQLKKANDCLAILTDIPLDFRTLKADEIDVRVGNVKKDKDGNVQGFSLLLYKDARVDMTLLDEVVGKGFWQREHKQIKNVVYCGVSIWSYKLNQWVTKWDAGAESETEKEKGEASDSFKRACVNWGIGRELYTSPFIWIVDFQSVRDKFTLKSITYDDSNRIIGLNIFNETLKKTAFETSHNGAYDSPLSIDKLRERYKNLIREYGDSAYKEYSATHKGNGTPTEEELDGIEKRLSEKTQKNQSSKDEGGNYSE
jgi:hypothetical protein